MTAQRTLLRLTQERDDAKSDWRRQCGRAFRMDASRLIPTLRLETATTGEITRAAWKLKAALDRVEQGAGQ